MDSFSFILGPPGRVEFFHFTEVGGRDLFLETHEKHGTCGEGPSRVVFFSFPCIFGGGPPYAENQLHGSPMVVVWRVTHWRNGAQWSRWWLAGEDGNREEIFRV